MVKRLVALLLFIGVSSTSYAAARHALVIGNSDYGLRYALETPESDSRAMATKLGAIGYEVHGGGALLDLSLDAFNDEFEAFLASVDDGDSTFIYYAGHGAASNGTNYLIPILPSGVRLRSDADIVNRTISLQGVLERVEDANSSGVNVFFFDACRDAPVENRTRSVNLSGLASLDAGRQPRGSFVGFSTEYGTLALDGDDPTGNSPFAMAVLDTLDSSADKPIELFYKEVTERVYDKTSGQQFPIQESKLRGEYCIVDCSFLGATAYNSASQEFGTLAVSTTPLASEVCYTVDGWETWNCGDKLTLPLNKPVKIRVTAEGHVTYFENMLMTSSKQTLQVQLQKKNSNNVAKILGGVAAILAVGALLSNDSGSSSDNATTITLVRPGQ